MSDSETDSTVLNSLEGEYKVAERYAMLKIVEKKKWVPLFQASHEGWLSQADFIPAMLKAVGENVHEAEKLEVVRLIEEKRYEDKKISGKLLLEIATHYIANKKEEVGAAKEENVKDSGPQETEGTLSALIGTFSMPFLSETFVNSIVPRGKIVAKQETKVANAVAEVLAKGEEVVLEELVSGGPGSLKEKWLVPGIHVMVWELLEKVAGRVMTELAADLGAEVDFTGKSLLHGIMAGGKSACLVREAIQKKARIMSATEKLQSKARVAKHGIYRPQGGSPFTPTKHHLRENEGIKCYNCKRMGHFAASCRYKTYCYKCKANAGHKGDDKSCPKNR